MKKGIVALLVIGLVSMAFCAWSPGAKAQPTDIDIDESPYTGSMWLFVPEETITIHVFGPENDIYVVKIVYDPGGTASEKRKWPPRTVPASGEIILEYEIPDTAASAEVYEVQVWDETETIHWAGVDYQYSVVLFRADVEVERDRYIAGERVTTHYMCWYAKDHSPVTDGYIDWLIEEDWIGGLTVETGSKTISDSDDAVGTFSIDLGTGASSGRYRVRFWLNDSESATPDHMVYQTDRFWVENLQVEIMINEATVPPWPVFTPGESVRVDVTVWVDGERTAGAEIDIIVREEGDVEDQYGADDLVTKSDGTVTHFFTLETNIDDGTEFEIEAEARLEDVTVSEIAEFTVEEEAVGELEVTLKFDKNIYLTGETIVATAEAQTTGTATADISYRFWIRKADWWGQTGGDLIDWTIQDDSELQWVIPNDFSGILYFEVNAKNIDGYEDWDEAWMRVVYGHLLVDADKKEYEAGDTITVSFELVSDVMTNPDFFYRVEAAGVSKESGPATTDHFTFVIPSIPADSYLFVVIAVEGGYAVEGSDTSRLLAGYFMSFEFDKEAYSPGDTITVKYEIKARGDSTLPSTFFLNYGLENGPTYSKQTTNAKGTLKYKIPDDINEGYQEFHVSEWNTASASEVVYIKSGLNPFEWARIGDMPLMEILLLILVIILFILVLRPRGPPKAAAPPAERPAPEPEPEPAPVEEAGASPMVINCKACGAPIELTTSKRPLEVMCPSCGETEMVQ